MQLLELLVGQRCQISVLFIREVEIQMVSDIITINFNN